MLRSGLPDIRETDLKDSWGVVQTLGETRELRAVRRSRTKAEHVAYRRLIATILGMDVVTLTSELRARRLGLRGLPQACDGSTAASAM
jgi:hypothetical protein